MLCRKSSFIDLSTSDSGMSISALCNEVLPLLHQGEMFSFVISPGCVREPGPR
eukprot:GDKH01028115.1.p3 GENE.GDKH01028115.1~~GDKH01028115.1.p3  ORF type:complete len:53 (-),score=2.33 GDKH01028115.1:101-259(-)